MTEMSFTEEYVPVGDLVIDRTVQRSTVDMKKVERLKRTWNDGAVGYLVVSSRKDGSKVLLDGQHRYLAYAQLTDNQGEMLSQVFTGLTLEQEAQLFLDTNYGNQPSLLDKFRVRVVAGDPVAIEINEMVRAYGWDISNNVQAGYIQAVAAVERIYRTGEALKETVEPHVLLSTLMVITHAWGLDRLGVQAVIMEGVAAIIAENDINLDLERLTRTLKTYPGGPLALHTDATQIASLKGGKVTMGVAEQLVDHYNKGRKTRTLTDWRRRR